MDLWAMLGVSRSAGVGVLVAAASGERSEG